MPNMTVRTTRAVQVIITAVTMMALASGCDIVSSMKNDGVSNPITPEQSRAQVVDAAKEIASILNLQVIEPAYFWHSSCNDQGDAPFRGEMRIPYPRAASFEASDAEVAQMIQRLQTKGWTTDSDANTHGNAVKKNAVEAIFYPQNAADATRSINLSGECRDVTTTKDTKGDVEDVNLSKA